MPDKEKIAELLHDVEAKGFWRYSKGDDGHDMTAEDIADYLIENGVMLPVRCKDCMYWKRMDRSCGWCEAWEQSRLDVGYCHCGERKVNEGN